MVSPDILLIAIGAYLMGSFPVARLIARCKRSSEPGITSIPCIVKVLVDISKGTMVVTIGCLDGTTCGLVALYALYLGHAYPIWRGVPGGNGLGTVLGGLVALDPSLGLSSLLSWMAAYFVCRSAAAAALMGSAGTLMAASLLPLPFPAIALLPLTALVYWRHPQTVRRALAGDPSEDEPAGSGRIPLDAGAHWRT